MLAAAITFAAAAALLTITPGLDTMFVLRASISSGRAVAMVGGLGVCLGTFTWACASALGLTALLMASQAGYDALRVGGAAYLACVGARMIWRSRRRAPSPAEPAREPVAAKPTEAFRTGLATNLLNPKVGVFYMTLLPQFVPHGAPVLAFSVLLAAIHAVEGIVWFAAVTAAAGRAGRLLDRPPVKRGIDRLTGLVFVGFGARLALEGRRAGVH